MTDCRDVTGGVCASRPMCRAQPKLQDEAEIHLL